MIIDQEHPAGKLAYTPSVDFCMQTSRLLVELQEFKKAVKMLDRIIKEDDSLVETWYLLCFCLVKAKKYQNANECVKNIYMLVQKQHISNEEFLEATKELEQTILKETGVQQDHENDVEMEDGGYETYSEEDISDDDKK